MNQRSGINRREFAGRTAAAAAGAAFLAPAPARHSIFVHLAGSPSHTDTFDFQPGPWTPPAMDPVRFGEILWPAGLFPQLTAHLDSIALIREIRCPSVVHREPHAARASFEDQCRDALALLHSGRAPRVIHVTAPGWDSHANIYGSALNPADPNSAARRFDAALATLLDDLKSARLFDQTLIVAAGEFGRTTGPLNHLGGRDHFPVMAALAAGATVPGRTAIYPSNRDFRLEDLEATVHSAAGVAIPSGDLIRELC